VRTRLDAFYSSRAQTELDEVPEGFIFTRKSVPIGVRQEQKRTVHYVANADMTVQIRVDPTGRGV
jgi:hypothetical protein